MANNYNIMAEYIVDKYIKRISGKDLPDIFVEDDPTERIMVGMLALSIRHVHGQERFDMY